MCVLVHVDTPRSRSPLYIMGGYVTEGVGRRLLYKVLERRPRSQCVVVMAVNGCMLNAMCEMCR